MAKLPFAQFFPVDWEADTSPLSPESRGLWIDILSRMWRSDPRTGKLTYTVPEWGKVLRCTPAQLQTFVEEAVTFDLCDVHIATPTQTRQLSTGHSHTVAQYFRSESLSFPLFLTFVSRRIHRESEARVRDADRKKTKRNYDKLRKNTPPCPPDVHQKSGENPPDILYSYILDPSSSPPPPSSATSLSDEPNPPIKPPAGLVVEPPVDNWKAEAEAAWVAYPKRDGKRLFKPRFLEFYVEHIKIEERMDFLAAVKEYARFCGTSDRTPKDPHRFISGRDGELWRDFIPTKPIKAALMAPGSTIDGRLDVRVERGEILKPGLNASQRQAFEPPPPEIQSWLKEKIGAVGKEMPPEGGRPASGEFD